MEGIHVMELAQNLLAQFGSLYRLMTADWAAFNAVRGVGISKYAQLQAVAELARRLFSSHLAREDAMLNPDVTQQYLQLLLAHQEREVFFGHVSG
ncbi:hypothetical protein OS12_32830 [Dickeya oryzae]